MFLLCQIFVLSVFLWSFLLCASAPSFVMHGYLCVGGEFIEKRIRFGMIYFAAVSSLVDCC
jgi:hypothetical protein